MHFVVMLLGGAAAAIWYFRVFSQGASEVADAANTLANLPRRRRFAKAAKTSGYALLQSPVEAATALLVSIAKMGGVRAVTPEERTAILGVLTGFLQQDREGAKDLLTQVEALLYERINDMDAIAPCVRILHPALERDHAEGLAEALERVAEVTGPTRDQRRFVANYRERMGLD